jgi:hypothetical protein
MASIPLDSKDDWLNASVYQKFERGLHFAQLSQLLEFLYWPVLDQF